MLKRAAASPTPEYLLAAVDAKVTPQGSVGFVPLSGHTPGSLGVFVSPSAGERFFHVGDAVNTIEAVEKRRGKSIILQGTDEDGSRAARGVC